MVVRAATAVGISTLTAAQEFKMPIANIFISLPHSFICLGACAILIIQTLLEVFIRHLSGPLCKKYNNTIVVVGVICAYCEYNLCFACRILTKSFSFTPNNEKLHLYAIILRKTYAIQSLDSRVGRFKLIAFVTHISSLLLH